MSDAYGNVTTIDHDASGMPTRLVAPFGQTTALQTDGGGYLSSFTDPLSFEASMSYTNGLLESFTDRRNMTSSMTYDELGRLTTDRDAAGKLLSIAPDGDSTAWSVVHQSDDLGSRRYDQRNLPSGAVERTVTIADGSTAVRTRMPDGTVTVSTADGTSTTETRQPDPRFGPMAPLWTRTTRLPSGLTRTEQLRRSATLANPNDPLSLTELTEQRTVNGNTWTSVFNASTKTWTTTTPAGRRTFVTLTNQGAVAESRVDGLLGNFFNRDPQGRLSTVSYGSRQWTSTYLNGGPAAGFLETTRDPLLQVTSYTRDAVGGVLTESSAAGDISSFGRDANGNLTSLTPPGRPTHNLTYTPVGLLKSYEPPVLQSTPGGNTVYEYDLARNVKQAKFPDGTTLGFDYDSVGRLLRVDGPDGAWANEYFGPAQCPGCSPGSLSHVISPYGVGLDFTYDGRLLTSSTWSGAVFGSVASTYNTDFRVSAQQVVSGSGSAPIQFGYDSSGLLTCASSTSCTPAPLSALRINYAPTHGLPTTRSVGVLTETLTYSSFGELASQYATLGAQPPFQEAYDDVASPRDALGRITRRTETLSGVATTWDYHYDGNGRLSEARLGGALYGQYTYDANGNLTLVLAPGGDTGASYDAQDRLLSYGPWTFNYTANGDLESKHNTVSGEMWGYHYNLMGDLTRVDLPNGDRIEYLVDGLHRRVGRLKNGLLVKQWLYADSLRPVAELDGAGSLVSRFVWSKRAGSPDLVIRGGTTYRLLYDHLGSPRMLIDPNTGVIAGVIRHDPWGKVLEDSLSSIIPFGFAGGINDAETGLIRFGARDYDPLIGRWLSKDPIGFAGQQTNLYAYVGNDPINYVDPTGRAATAATGGAVVTLGPIVIVGAAAGSLVCALVPSCRDAVKRAWDNIWKIRKPDIREIDEICRRTGLDRALRRRLHDEITGQDLGLEEIEAIARELAKSRKPGPLPEPDPEDENP